MIDPTTSSARQSPVAALTEAQWYDLSIDWVARIRREIPLLMEVFGPPGSGGILDAGCGTGHQVAALCKAGYRAVGADLNPEMLEVARSMAEKIGVCPTLIESAYADLPARAGTGFDAVYCLANSLAAAGTQALVHGAIAKFAQCLRIGGKLFIQILNFPPMRREVPCVKGPRITRVDGVEYVSVRHFAFEEDSALVSNITLWNDGAWHTHAQGRRLYAVTLDELRGELDRNHLRIDSVWGGYDKGAFDPERSIDLIVAATRA